MSRILLIEDDQPFRRALSLHLTKAGYAITEVEHGRAGLAAHQAQPFDLIVTDLIMPEMEGVETIRALRKITPTLPIIAMSGGGRSSPEDYLSIARQFGAAAVLAKPFALKDLTDAIAGLLGAK